MGIRQTAAWQAVARQRGFRHFTLNVGIFCTIMSLCVFSNGFDLIGYSNIQAMNGKHPASGRRSAPAQS